MEIEHIITHSIIANQLALNHNESLKHTPIYKQTLKNKSIPIYDAQNIITIINAYKKDAKSIEGICRKILK